MRGHVRADMGWVYAPRVALFPQERVYVTQLVLHSAYLYMLKKLELCLLLNIIELELGEALFGIVEVHVGIPVLRKQLSHLSHK